MAEFGFRNIVGSWEIADYGMENAECGLRIAEMSNLDKAQGQWGEGGPGDLWVV